MARDDRRIALMRCQIVPSNWERCVGATAVPHKVARADEQCVRAELNRCELGPENTKGRSSAGSRGEALGLQAAPLTNQRAMTAVETAGVPDDAPSIIRTFTERIVNEALQIEALESTVKSAKQFIAQATIEYTNRFLFELIQNAYDAHGPDGGGRVRILLDFTEGEFGTLYVANTGHPFAEVDFRSICEIARSSKAPGEGIGNKGVGFKSVIQIAEWPEIYSSTGDPGPQATFDGFCFTYSRFADMLDLVGGDEGKAAVLDERMSSYSLPRVLDEQPREVRLFAQEGYASVIRLPLRSEGAASMARPRSRGSSRARFRSCCSWIACRRSRSRSAERRGSENYTT